MRIGIGKNILLAAAAWMGPVFLAGAAEKNPWPDFRGPDGQGHSDAKGLPISWSETENVAWKTPVPGKGWSSPIIGPGQIWLTTAIEAAKPDDGTPPTTHDFKAAKPGPGTKVNASPLSLRVLSFDVATGKPKFNTEAFFIEKPGNVHSRNSYASPSPVLDGDRLYVHFGTYGTACISTVDGKVLWRNTEHVIEHENGPGSTPIVYKDKLIFCCDGIDFQYLLALDTKTGKVAWKTKRSVEIPKPPPQRKAYATPLIVEVGGKTQVVTPAAEAVYAYDPEDGKELWRLLYNGYSNVARPITGHGLIFISTGFNTPEMLAIKPEGTGELPAANIVWRDKIQASRQASPLLSGDLLYMYSDGGVARCLEAKTGKELWRQKMGVDGAASPLAADGKVYFFDGQQGAFVVEDSGTYKELKRNALESSFMASAAVVDKALILRTTTHLYRIEAK